MTWILKQTEPVKSHYLIFLAALALTPAFAADVSYNGHTLKVADGQDDGPIQRMFSAQYTIPGTGADIINRAQTCAGGVEGMTVESSDPDGGLLALRTTTDYRSGFSGWTIRSRMDFSAADAAFRITASEIAVRQGSGDDATFAPLAKGASGWEKGLDALLAQENKLVDCLYR